MTVYNILHERSLEVIEDIHLAYVPIILIIVVTVLLAITNRMIKNVFKAHTNECNNSAKLEQRNNYLRLLLLFNYLLFQ